jgi:enterochelin esterase-like enzyme
MKLTKSLTFGVLAVILSGYSAAAQTGTSELVNVMAPAPSLSHSLFQTATEQPAAIYLPPSYHDSTQRFPVVYFLPGFGCPIHYFTAWQVFQGFDLQQSLDSLIRNGIAKEMIVVLPNGLNFMGGSFYTNSPVTGNWEDFIARDLVRYVDSLYRTIRVSTARGITGYSMGGSGALSMAMKYPDIFGLVYALSPGVFAPGGLARTDMFAETRTIDKYLDRQADFDRIPPYDARVRFMSYIDNLYKANLEMEAFSYAYGAAFAPDTNASAPFIDYPYKRINGEPAIDSLVWGRFESGFGDWPHKIAAYRSNLLKLTAITIDYGTKDENSWIPAGCVYLSSLLDSAAVRHQLLSFDGGHGDRVRERIESQIIPFFSSNLSRE